MKNKYKYYLLILLPLIPVLVYYITAFIILKDIYIAINLSYFVLLIILQFVEIEKFLLFHELRALWNEQSESVKHFIFEPAEYSHPVIKIAPKVVLNDANISNIAKLKYLIGETGEFIPGFKDEFKKNLFLNIFLLFALFIISSFVNQEAGSLNDPAKQVIINDKALNIARISISYFAIVMQLVWFGRLIFYIRQKNAAFYFNTISTKI